MKQNLQIKFFLLLALAMVGSSNVWGLSKTTWTWTAKTAIGVGSGTVRAAIWKDPVAGSDSEETGQQTSGTSLVTASKSESAYYSTSVAKRYCKFTVVSTPDGYAWGGWYSSSACTGAAVSTETSYQPASSAVTNMNYTYYGKFNAVTVSAAAAKSVSFTSPGTKSTSLTFSTQYADADADFNTPSISGDGWTITSWSYANNAVTVNVSYTASSSTSQGNHASTITVKSKANKSATGTVTANVDLSPSLSASPSTIDFGMFTVGVDAKKSSTATLTFNANAINWSKTSDADLAPFSAAFNGDHSKVTIYYEPTSVGTGSYQKTLTITTTNSQSSPLAKSTTITLNGQAQSITNPTYTCSIANSYNVDAAAIDLNALWTSTSPSTKNYSIVSFTPSGSNNQGATAPSITNNMLSLGQAGTLVLKLTQAKVTSYYAGEDTKQITINKIQTTISGSNQTKEVEENFAGVYSFTNTATAKPTNNSSDAFYYTITNNTPTGIVSGSAHSTEVIAYNPNENKVYVYNKGVATIKFAQKETYKYTGKTQEYTVTVNKHENHIAINGTNDSYAQNIYMDGYASINLTATNTDYAGSAITNNQTAGNDIATFYQNQNVVYASNILGDATWSLSQPENYKYKAANASFTIHVVKQSEATDCYVLNAPDEKSYGKYGDCANKSYQDFNLSAPGKTLSFNMWKYSSTNDIGMKVYGYDANGSQVFLQEYSIGSLTTSAKNYSFNIASNVTRIRIQNGGGNYATASTLNCYASEVKVTRLTNLSAADVTVDKTSTNNPIHPTETGVGSITINHSLANGGDLKVTWDNAKFTINDKTSAQGINLGDKGCSTGNTTLPISYTSQVAGEDVAHLVIYNNVYRATATITGTTVKFDQVITWADNIEYKTAGVDIENAATSTLGNVTYTSSNPEVISVVGNVLHTIKKGTATITAHSAGNAEYNEKYSDKLITVTDDKVQWIEWNQTLTNLKLGDSNKTLNASAHSDVTGCVSEGARPITYSSSDESVVKVVNTNQLCVVGVGTATVTATQAGGEDADGHTFIPTSTQKKAIVRDPSAACETYIYNQPEEWKKDMGWNSAYHHSHTQEIDFGGQEPGYYNVDYKGESHDVAVAYYNVNFYIDQYVNGSWVNVQDLGKPAEDQTLNTGNVNLNRKATKMRFRVDGYTGYTTFKDCQVTLARYIETANTLNKFEAKVGGVHEQTLTIRYSNVQGPLTITHNTSSSFALDVTEKATVCGDYGTMDVKVTYNPLVENDDEKDVLVISDGVSSINVNLSGVASITNRHIVWEQTPAPVYTIQTVTLTAEARTDLDAKAGEVFYAMDGTSTTGSVTGNTLSFAQDGTAKVIAQAVADPKYSAAAAVSKTWTVSKTPTTISTMPTAFGDIVSGTNIASLTLTGWEVTNTVNSEVVEGTLAITAGDLVNVGDKNLTITFTPTNTNMFTGCTANMPVHVIQRAPEAGEVIPVAADITYGAAVKTSVLTNNGTLAGTLTWIDARKDDILTAGTYNDMEVLFTPNNTNIEATNYTVTLTINAPIITENKFTNADGDNNWNNPNNWTSGVVPEKLNDVDVVINGEMVIDETIIVNSMTIESGASVKVIVNGDLSIHDASLARDSYGDLFIKNGGAVELSSTSSKKMMVHNFVIESSIGTDGTSTSGQISNADALAFDEGGDAYIDINLDPSGIADDSKWYGFTVPFQVDIATGIARKENDGSFKVLADKTNFDIMKYNSDKRLSSGKGWEYYHGTLQPGEFYLLAIDGSNNVYSFRKKAGAALVSDGTMALKTNGTGTNANWNAVGNPTMQQVKAEFSNKIVQVYLNGLNQYKAVSTEDANFVVGCPFFIQASTNENLTLTADNSHSTFYAPRREANVSDMFRVRFGQDAEHYSDQIFVSASEDALDQYEIGHDVAKVGVGTISAQLWVNAYSQKLCAHEAVLTNNNADFALTLYAPKAGEYTVSINREKMPNDAALYLTENGNIIWNLSTSDYTVELNKGNNTSYGLRLVQERRITTDTENVETKAQTNKMIINSNMYIFREGKIYDATGKLVKY